MSPLADGPIKFSGELVDDLKIDDITKYGRSFSIVRVPYSFKLLMQELNTMNICMRIITEDNIDQLSSMSFGAQINSSGQFTQAIYPNQSYPLWTNVAVRDRDRDPYPDPDRS